LIIKNINPTELENWLIQNKEIIYRETIQTCLDLLLNENLEEPFLSFEWEGKNYAKISVKFSDIPEVVEKSTNFFVREELYEEAEKAQKILKLYNSSKNK
jgi:hypothetical protein